MTNYGVEGGTMIVGSPFHKGPLMGESESFKELRTVDAQTFVDYKVNVSGPEDTVASLIL